MCDQDPAFMSSLCRYCFQQYKIQILTVGVANYKSLQAEHGIKSLSNLILTHLTGLGRDWHIYAKPCMLTYNSFSTPNLDGFCPFELVFGRKPRIVPILEVTPPVPVTGTFKDAYDLLNKRLKYCYVMLWPALTWRGQERAQHVQGQLLHTCIMQAAGSSHVMELLTDSI